MSLTSLSLSSLIYKTVIISASLLRGLSKIGHIQGRQYSTHTHRMFPFSPSPELKYLLISCTRPRPPFQQTLREAPPLSPTGSEMLRVQRAVKSEWMTSLPWKLKGPPERMKFSLTAFLLLIFILILTTPALHGQSSESTCLCRAGMRKGYRAASSEVMPRALSSLSHQPQGLSPPAAHLLSSNSPLQAELGWGPDPFWDHQAVPGSWVKDT